jgi:hypothetical protein
MNYQVESGLLKIASEFCEFIHSNWEDIVLDLGLIYASNYHYEIIKWEKSDESAEMCAYRLLLRGYESKLNFMHRLYDVFRQQSIVQEHVYREFCIRQQLDNFLPY